MDGQGDHLARPLLPDRPGGDPFLEGLVLPRVDREPLAAAVLDLAAGLEQHQAPVGIDGVDAATQQVATQGVMVLLGIVAEQRQPEASLALERAVARARGAAQLAEQAHDVPLEIDLVVGQGRLGRNARNEPEQC